MPLHTLEELDSSLPIICVFSRPTESVLAFITSLLPKFKVIFVSEESARNHITSENYYFISHKEILLLGKLQENIDYAVVNVTDKEETVFIDNLINKFTHDKTKTLFLFPILKIGDYEILIQSLVDNKNFYIGGVGELLDGKRKESQNEFSTIIKTAISKGEVTLTGNDLYPVYPITIGDFISGVNKILFSTHEMHLFFCLFYSHPETILSAIHLLGRVYPDIQVYFREQKDLPPRHSRAEIEKFIKTQLEIKEEYLDKYLKGFELSAPELDSLTIEAETSRVEVDKDDNKKAAPTRKKRRARSSFNFIVTSLILSILIFVITNAVLLGTGLFLLKKSITSFEQNRYSSIYKQTRYAKLLLNTARPTVYLVSELISPIDKEGRIRAVYDLIDRSLSLAQLAAETVHSADAKSLTKNQLESILSSITYLYSQGERIKLEQNNKALNSLLTLNQSKIISLFQVMPKLLGFEKEKQYLILFQNNGELRPTGGFIGSVGELSLMNGKITDLKIRDVYELDGQLKQHIEPPFVVRRFLQPHLYLRDSNFYTDFQETASKSALIYNLETGKRPDGVIGIDFEVLKQIIGVVGPIKLRDGTSVSKDNAFEYIQQTIKEGNFPGSTQKKSILDEVFTQVLLRLEENKNKWLDIALLAPDLLEQKHIVVAFRETPYQAIFNANNFGGEFEDKRDRQSGIQYDFLSINEANIGVNKANIGVSRSVEYQADISSLGIQSKTTLKLTNNFTEQYKPYIKVYVPRKSKLESITINGVKQNKIPAITDTKIYEAKTFKPTGGQFEVEESEEYGFTFFAFITTVPPKEEQTIELLYSNGAATPLKAINPYSFLFLKQPGTAPYVLTSSVLFPENYKPLNAKALSFGKNFLRFEDTIVTDKEYSISLQRKTEE